MSRLAYRPDIDGLRAIAVLAVVLYHLGLGPLHGGFVGVDVFFVISGYLITGIIRKEVEREDFTFAGFYERRARRIFPALFVVLLSTLMAGAWLLLPSDLVRLGRATLATVFFASNVLFWRESGYFETSSEYNALLHTWSLGVEEQFYIGLPVLLLVAHRFFRRFLKPFLAACVVASFLLCVWQQGPRPTATFFLSPFRAWELLAGAMLAVGVAPPVTNRWQREILSLSALLLLAGSIRWIEEGVTFPGWRAALPVLATATLIHTGSGGDSLARRLLQWRPLVLVGLISYSLYLWHWPLLVYARYRMGMQPLPPTWSWGLAVTALLLSIASYRWVETPFRRDRAATPTPRRRVALVSLGAMSILVVLAVGVQLDRGWQRRFPAEVVAYDAARDPEIPFIACAGIAPPHAMDSGCVGGDKGASRRVLLWGDSYALAWAPAFDRLGQAHGFAVELAWMSECPGLLDVEVSESRNCRPFNEAVAARVRAGGLSSLVLVGSWEPYLDLVRGPVAGDAGRGGGDREGAFAAGLRRTIEHADASGVRVVLVGPTPGAPGDIPYRLAAATAFGLEIPSGRPAAKVQASRSRFWGVVAPVLGPDSVTQVDPAPWFEEGEQFRYLDDRGGLLYRDGGHLSIAGASYVEQRFPVRALFGSPGLEPPQDGRR